MIEGLYKPFKHWTEKGTVWIYSDPHFGDLDARYFDLLRPTDDELVDKINKCVGKHDTLIILGDIGDTKYITKLRGYKILVCGNHDSGASHYERKVEHIHLSTSSYTFEEAKAIGMKEYPDWNIYCTKLCSMIEGEFWNVTADNNLFEEIYTGPLIIGKKLILSHEPIDLPYMFNIHGHIHNREYLGDDHHLNCVAEVIDYTPINLNQFMKTGFESKIDDIHRITIDRATENKKKNL